MNIPCPNPGVVCTSINGDVVDPSNPLGNFSSEAPDAEAFFARNYGNGRFPKLGSRYYARGCIGFASSVISQEEADIRAANQSVQCNASNNPVRITNPQANVPGQPPFIYVPRQVYGNTLLACNFTCSDGTVTSYTVTPNTFLDFSVAAANARAYAFACRQAIAARLCFSDLSRTRFCMGSAMSVNVNAQSAGVITGSSISSGSLPPGVELSQTGLRRLALAGTPTASGTYQFTITATNSLGGSNSRSYTMYVTGITNGLELPDAGLDEEYSVILQAEGPLEGDVVWSVVAGELPDGLSLDASTGEISGTPAEEGVFNFGIRMSDDNSSCSKEFILTVENQCGSTFFEDLSWTTVITENNTCGGADGTAAGTAVGNAFSGSASCPAAPSGGGADCTTIGSAQTTATSTWNCPARCFKVSLTTDGTLSPINNGTSYSEFTIDVVIRNADDFTPYFSQSLYGADDEVTQEYFFQMPDGSEIPVNIEVIVTIEAVAYNGPLDEGAPAQSGTAEGFIEPAPSSECP